MSTLKKILLILWMLLGLVACQPGLTYQEMNDARAVASGEQAAELDKRIERIEKAADRANAFYENKMACIATDGHVWFCRGAESRAGKVMEFPTVDALVRAYRNDKHICRCVTESEIHHIMRSL